jgi:hypothetical protein
MRSRLLHFAALGAVLFVTLRLWPQAETAARSAIVVRPTSDPAQFERQVDDEMLFHEALAHNVDARDAKVRGRLVRLGRFLGLAADGGDEAVEHEARAIGLQRSDPAVRHHLIEMMRLAASHTDASDLPSEDELRAYYEQHAGHFEQPARVRLTQVYVSRERRGARTDADASELLAGLRQRGARPSDAATVGDPFVHGASIPLASASQLERLFGPDFAAAAFEPPEGRWSGPLSSAYGLHLVWIEQRVPATVPPLSAVRNQVLHQFLHDRGEARLADTLRTWRARYDVQVEPIAGAAN